MKFDVRDLRRALEAFEKEEWDEVHLVADGFELHLRAGAEPLVTAAAVPAAPVVAPPPPPAPVAAPEVVAAAPASQAIVPTAEAPQPAPAAAEPPADLPPGAVDVKSPSVGIFWRSPSPGAPPFVEVGDVVGPDDTLCIVEVMKLMTPLKPGVAGTVARIHPSNGDRLDKDQLLFTLVPA